jgi:hypothetical protein
MPTGEPEIALAVMRIANAQSNGVASYSRLRKDIPSYVPLMPDDLRISATRPREPMWHQIFRNIKSHFVEDGNAISEGLLEHVRRVGYRITPKGQSYLSQLP